MKPEGGAGGTGEKKKAFTGAQDNDSIMTGPIEGKKSRTEENLAVKKATAEQGREGEEKENKIPTKKTTTPFRHDAMNLTTPGNPEEEERQLKWGRERSAKGGGKIHARGSKCRRCGGDLTKKIKEASRRTLAPGTKSLTTAKRTCFL